MRLGRPSMQHQKLELAAALNQSPIVAGAMQMSKPTTTRCVTPPSKERCCSQQYHMNVGKRWSCSIEITPIPSSVITDACSKCVCVCVCVAGRKAALWSCAALRVPLSICCGMDGIRTSQTRPCPPERQSSNNPQSLWCAAGSFLA